jgi:hypothetical protein
MTRLAAMRNTDTGVASANNVGNPPVTAIRGPVRLSG